jgi:hypothetical protein
MRISTLCGICHRCLQGKTSRWALAWSFTADAAAASKPLPRFPAGSNNQAEGQQQQGPAAAPALVRPMGRKLSWQVAAPAGAAASLLDAAQRCLQQAGVKCTVDRATYSLRGSYEPTEAEVAAAADADPAAKRPRLEQGEPNQQEQQQQHGPWQLEVRLFMQHAGLFMLTCALGRATPDGALAWWRQQAQRLQQALSAKWKVQT